MLDVAVQLAVMALPAGQDAGAAQVAQPTVLLVAKPEADHVEPGTHATREQVCDVAFQA